MKKLQNYLQTDAKLVTFVSQSVPQACNSVT